MLKPVQGSTFTFRNLIEGGFVYVDKTEYLYNLVRPASGIFFLSRPRRFGKSLMLSTLEEIFLGNRHFFKGLWIDSSDYNWQRYPVIRLDFSWNAVKDAETLKRVIDSYIEEIAEMHGITIRGFDYQSRFRNLLLQLGKTEKLVLLIDEYDKPLIDNLENIPQAIEIREVLKNFYTIIKAMDRYLRFVFITGISKFSKVGVFSSMNNLTDLSMNPRFATALGITEEELEHYFRDHIIEFAAKEGTSVESLTAKIREWYNGFCFVENSAKVYNPFSTLQLFYNQRFDNYWFESGTPTFLIQLLKVRGYDIQELEKLELAGLSFSMYELEQLEVISLLFQTGYLTITAYDPTYRFYQLGYPTFEVEEAFLTYLLAAFNITPKAQNDGHLWQLINALETQALDQFFDILQVFFAEIPYGIQVKEEKYYQSIFYLIFKLIGLRIDAEVQTNQGRIDVVIQTAQRIFLFEFKLDKDADTALQQIRDNDYARKYQLQRKPITLVGANFDSRQRRVTEWKAEEV